MVKKGMMFQRASNYVSQNLALSMSQPPQRHRRPENQGSTGLVFSSHPWVPTSGTVSQT